MKRTVLQIPLQPELKKAAEKQAESAGFSSLQEVVRVFLREYVDKKLAIQVSHIDDEPPLSAKAARRYERILKQIKAGKGVTKTDNLDELFAYLES